MGGRVSHRPITTRRRRVNHAPQTMGQGERRLRETLRRRRRAAARPQPDSDWGWAVEDRLARVEDGQKWILRLMVGGIVVMLIEAALRGVAG